MPKITTLDGFGPRLAALRQSRGMTQVELGRAATQGTRAMSSGSPAVVVERGR